MAAAKLRNRHVDTSRSGVLFDIACVLLAIFGIVVSLTAEVSVEIQFLPTIINGIISSVSLMIGFILTSIALTITRSSLEPLKHRSRIVFTLILLMYPIGTLFASFVLLALGEFQNAFRSAMVGFIGSMVLLLDYAVFLTNKLEAMKEDRSSN